MEFNAYNKNLDISTDKVFSCQDMEQLRDWKRLMESEVMIVKNRISRMKGEYRDGIKISNVKFEDAKVYRRIQAVLLNQIVSRIIELKEISKKQKEIMHKSRVEVSLIFWKNKVKEISPDGFASYCKELKEYLTN